MKLKHLFIAVLCEWPALLWIISYMTAAGIAAWWNHSAGGDHWFTEFALCVSALCFTALVAMFALIVVTARRLDNHARKPSDHRCKKCGCKLWAPEAIRKSDCGVH
jgi:hypothetical protein